MDTRWHRLADILVNYSTKVQPGERVMIAMAELETAPLAHAVHRAVVKAGGLPQIQYLSEALRHDLMHYGSQEQAGWVPEIELHGMEWADVYLGLRGAANLNQHWDVATARKSASQKAQGIVSTARWQKTRWCLVRVPNVHLAHQAGIDEETLTDQFFQACFLDWAARAVEWREICRKLEAGDRIRIEGEGTDLTFSTAGRRWVAFDGTANMPDGEIATAPLTETIDGRIAFEHPIVLGGQLMERAVFEWRQGRLVSAKAETNQAFLDGILATDAGATLIGEFAFGLNEQMKWFSNDILLDEKIGGTLHIALGRAYPQCGGTNVSAIHWDMIKDTRSSGRVTLDGRPVFEAGRFLF